MGRAYKYDDPRHWDNHHPITKCLDCSVLIVLGTRCGYHAAKHSKQKGTSEESTYEQPPRRSRDKRLKDAAGVLKVMDKIAGK
jgi:hypothetical protein